MSFDFARKTYSLQPRSTITFAVSFASVWQPGVHVLRTSVYGDSGPEIWLLAPVVSRSAPLCKAGQLQLLLSTPVSEATGQHTTELAVRNTSRAPCNLDGYPRVGLLDRHHHEVPFAYHYGGDQMLTAARPARVGIASGGYAYFAINKYRCDKGSLDVGIILLVAVLVNAPTVSLSSGISVDYCGQDDPGTTISVSPFEINQIELMSV